MQSIEPNPLSSSAKGMLREVQRLPTSGARGVMQVAAYEAINAEVLARSDP